MKGKVFFHPIDGSGALTISWSSIPKGDAIEPKKGSGVGFFSESGDLLCVIFDEVRSDDAHQILEFDKAHIEITVIDGKVEHKVTQSKPTMHIRKRNSNRKQTI